MSAASEPPTRTARRLGALLQRLNAWVLDAELTDDERGRLADALDGLVAAASTPGSRYVPEEAERFPGGTTGGLDPRGTHPYYGAAAGTSTPMALGVQGERAELRVRYDVRHEGAPGRVHGGVIAAGFDIVLGRAATEFGARGPTGEMTVRYLEPSPLHVELDYRAWLERREGRKSFVAGELRRSDTRAPCARGWAVYIAPADQVTGGTAPVSS